MDDELFQAIDDNNLALVYDRVRSGAIINSDYFPSIRSALRKGYVEMMRMLTVYCADLHLLGLYGDSPLITAVQIGNLAMLELLLQAGIQMNGGHQQDITLLITAICNNHSHVVEYFIRAGVDVNEASTMDNGFTPLHKAAELEDDAGLNIVNILLAVNANVGAVNDAQQTPLHVASLNGNVEVVKRLLAHNAEINVMERSNCTPLALAACAGHSKVVQELCLQSASLSLCNKSGLSPFHLAVVGRHVGTVKMLLRFGAPIDALIISKSMRTPLLELMATSRLKLPTIFRSSSPPKANVALISKEIELIDVLRRAGASLNAVDAEGNSCLHLCVTFGTEEVLDYLINRGADPVFVNRDLHTVLSLACTKNDPEIIVKLIKAYPSLINHRNNFNPRVMRSPFVLLYKACQRRCVCFLLEAGYRPTKPELDGCELFEVGSHIYNPFARYLENNELSQLWSLRKCCKVVIRDALHNNLRDKVSRLRLPQKLMDYLLLESYDGTFLR